MRSVHTITALAIVLTSTHLVSFAERAGADRVDDPTPYVQEGPPAVVASPAFQRVLESAPLEFRNQFVKRQPPAYYMPKKPGVYSVDDWAATIDSTWGPGLPWDFKLNIWTTFWNTIDSSFACFHGLDPSLWDTVWNRYLPEIQDTVSRGRFCAILQHASRPLLESHTKAQDKDVVNTYGAPGVPIMYVGDWGSNTRFGAGLTPLADSSLLVYQAADAHPLGLEPGDRVLGYNGVAWKDLLPGLLAAELPLTWNSYGSTPASSMHRMLMCAGRNWHLFDTIDIARYAAGDTVHLPTSLMTGGTTGTYNSEQLDIAGVPKPDALSGQWVSWGIIDGTQIGYIYGQAWVETAGADFYAAVRSIMEDHSTTGLIIDFRLNYGGNMFQAYAGLELLFQDTVRSVRWYERCDPDDRLAMCPFSDEDQATIYPNPSNYYDKPIAVLTGPGALSSGDQIALRMAYHPMARFFGKPTDGAFNSPLGRTLHSSMHFWYAHYDPALHSNPGHCLTHDQFPSASDFPWVPFEEVWLTPDNVAQGIDDVVEAATTWILSRDYDQDGIVNENDNCLAYSTPGNDPVLTGDVNIDGVITSADLVWLVGYVFRSGMSPMPIPEAGDVNCDGVVNSTDIVYSVNHVFKGGPEPCNVCLLVPAV